MQMEKMIVLIFSKNFFVALSQLIENILLLMDIWIGHEPDNSDWFMWLIDLKMLRKIESFKMSVIKTKYL